MGGIDGGLEGCGYDRVWKGRGGENEWEVSMRIGGKEENVFQKSMFN